MCERERERGENVLCLTGWDSGSVFFREHHCRTVLWSASVFIIDPKLSVLIIIFPGEVKLLCRRIFNLLKFGCSLPFGSWAGWNSIQGILHFTYVPLLCLMIPNLLLILLREWTFWTSKMGVWWRNCLTA